MKQKYYWKYKTIKLMQEGKKKYLNGIPPNKWKEKKAFKSSHKEILVSGKV